MQFFPEGQKSQPRVQPGAVKSGLSRCRIPHSTGDKTQFAYRAVHVSRSDGVFKKKEIGRKPPPWKKVGHGGKAGATTVQSYQNRERNLKSWSSKAYSRRGDDGAVYLPKGKETLLAHGAVQLSGAKAFSLRLETFDPTTGILQVRYPLRCRRIFNCGTV